MPSLLRALPVLALALAAVETVRLRSGLAPRPVAPWLFPQAFLLWCALGALACLPAWCCARLLAGRDADRGLAPALWLAGWTVLPVLGHAVLDRYTAPGGDVAALGTSEPWTPFLGAVLGGALALWLVGRSARRLRPRTAALALVPAALVAGTAASLPRADPAGAGAPASADLPNLCLVVWDTCRADRLEPYGYERPTTPHLARLADDSVVFEEARSAAVFTFTSHLTLLTGTYPSVHGGGLHRMRYDPGRAASAVELLRAAGYRTAAFVGTDVLAGHTGLDHGFDHYDDRVDPPVCETAAWGLVHDVQSILARRVPALRFDGRPHWIQDFQRPAGDVLAAARSWIRRDDGRPWFCLVNLYDAHWPYLPGNAARGALVRPYEGRMDGFLFRSDAWREGYEPDAEDRRHVSDLYDAELQELDRAVDAFLASLDLERTGLVLTADHGEAFGEGGRWKHEDVLEPQVRVPLLVRPPGGVEPLRLRARAAGVDVAPTLLALAGLAPPGSMQGRDLLAGGRRTERPILVEHLDLRDPTDAAVALYRGPWKLVRRSHGGVLSHELFDLRLDPLGLVDRAAAHLDVVEELSLELLALSPPGPAREPDAVRAGRLDALRALGYAE